MSQVRELTFTIDTLSDVDLSGVNTTLRHLSTKKRPVEPRHIVDFSAISKPDDRTVILRITLDEGIFIADTTSPRNGKNFITGHAPQVATVVMSNALDPNLNGTVKFDGATVPSAQVTLDGQHVLKIDLATAFPSTYNAVGGHTIEVSGFADIEGNPQTQDEMIGYAVDPLASSIDTGEVMPYTANLKTGILRCSRLVMERGANIEEQLTRYLRQRGMDREHILHQSLVTTNQATLELYVLYLESVNPRLLKSFPNQGSTLSLSNPPTTYFFTFSAPLSLQCIQNNQAVLYDGTYVGDANVSLTPDEQTLVVDISGLAGANTAGLHSFELTDLCGVDGVNFTSVPTYIDVTVAEVPDADANAGGGASNAFGTVDAGGTNLVAVGDDTLSIDAGAAVTVTGDAGTNTATIAVDETQISHDNIADTGTLTHPQIDTQIGQLQTDVGTNTTDIGTNTTNIGTNATAITNLDNDLTAHTGAANPHGTTIVDLDDTPAVAANTDEILRWNGSAWVFVTDLTDLETAVTTNTTNIGTNTSNISTNTNAINNHIADTSGNPHQVTLEEARSQNPALSGQITIATSPSSPTHVATKGYVDSEISAIPAPPTLDSDLSNDKYVTGVNGVIGPGAVTIDPDDLDDTATTNKFVSQAEKDDIGTAVQPDTSVNFTSVTQGGTAVILEGDSRLTDARTPLSHTHVLADITDSGTSAGLNVAVTGDAAPGEVVKGNDSRLTDARTPLSHNHVKADITDFSDADYATPAQGAKADTAVQPAAIVNFRPVIDEDDMVSDSDAHVPTQQSVKAYVDGEIAGIPSAPVVDVNGQTGNVLIGIQELDETFLPVTNGTNTGKVLEWDGSAWILGAEKLTPSGNGSSLTGITAAQVGADPAGTDNSTPVTLDTTNHNYLSLAAQEITLEPIDLAADVTGNLPYSSVSGTPTISTFGETLIDDVDAAAARTTLGVDAAGTDNSTPVTLDITSHDYLSLTGQEIALGPVNLTTDVTGQLPYSDVSGTPTISSFGETLIDDATAADARTTLGVDAAGTDNSTPVTLTGAPNYITISGQEITRNPIDLTTDVTNDLPVADGGTGASNAADARTNLGITPANIGAAATGDIPTNTDDVPEAATPTNKYFTDQRARDAISVTDSGGDGSLSYDGSTGVITYNGPSQSEVRAHITKTYVDGLAVDAGTLDGVDSTGFATASHNHSLVSLDDVATGVSPSDNNEVLVWSTGNGGEWILADLDDKANTSAIANFIEGSDVPTHETVISKSGPDFVGVGGTSNHTITVSAIDLADGTHVTNDLPITHGGTGASTAAQALSNLGAAAAADIPASTDNVPEGTTNKYFTEGRARNAISVVDNGGDGSLGYNNTSGVITYNGPSEAEVRTHITKAYVDGLNVDAGTLDGNAASAFAASGHNHALVDLSDMASGLSPTNANQVLVWSTGNGGEWVLADLDDKANASDITNFIVGTDVPTHETDVTVAVSGEDYIAAGGTNGHELTASAINLGTTHVTGTLPVSRGGTGASTAAGALTSLGAAAAADIPADTDDVPEGTNNLYHTTGRVDDRISLASVGDLSNVTLAGLADNQVLQYNSTGNAFENVTLSYNDLANKPTLGTAAAANIETTTTLGTSNTDVPSQNAVKEYVDDTAANLAASTHTHDLDDLNDVTITGTPSSSQVLKWDGTNAFINAQLAYSDITGTPSFGHGVITDWDTEVDARVDLKTGANLDLSQKDTDDLPESATRLYFTTSERSKLSGIATGAEVNVDTDLSYDASTRVISSSTGNNATLPEATTTNAGLLASSDKSKLDGVAAGAQVNVGTDLTYTASTRELASSTGSNATLPLVGANDGLMESGDKTKLDGIAAGAQVNVGTNLTYTPGTRILASSTGNNATLPEATTSDAGLIAASDKLKLDGIASGAQVNVGTNLTYDSGTNTLSSSTGSDTTLPVVGSDDGLMEAADKTKLDNIDQGLATTDSVSFTGLTVDSGNASPPTVTVKSTVSGATAAPEIDLVKDAASSNNQYLGQIRFKGENDAFAEHLYAKITGKINDHTAGSEEGIMEFEVDDAGTNKIVMRLRSNKVVINNDGGSNPTDLEVSGDIIVVGTVDGRDLATDGAKLDGIEALAQANVDTNLTYTPATRLLESSTGSDVTLPEATTTVPGLMSAQDKTDLGNALVAGTAVNLGTGSTLNGVNLVDEDHTHTAIDISDSTTVGRNVLTAATEGDARVDIGIGTGTEGTLDDGKYLKWNRTAGKYDLAIMPDAETWGDITNSGTLTLNGSGDNSKLDIDISGTLSNGEVLKWDSGNGKFVVGPSEGGSTDAVEAQGFFFG